MGMLDKQIAKLAAAAQTAIGDDEQVQVAVMGMGRNPYLTGGGLLGALLGKWRCLVVTDRSIKLLQPVAKTGGGKGFSGVITSVPRGTDLGQLKGINAKLAFPDGEKVYVSRAFFGRLDGLV